MEKEEELDRRRGGKTMLKSGQGLTLTAQLEQLKTGQDEKGFCEVIHGVPSTWQGYGIDLARLD